MALLAGDPQVPPRLSQHQVQKQTKKMADKALVAQRAGHGGASAAGQPLHDLHQAQLAAGLLRRLTPRGRALVAEMNPTATAKDAVMSSLQQTHAAVAPGRKGGNTQTAAAAIRATLAAAAAGPDVTQNPQTAGVAALLGVPRH
jgi:hypothetical protein